MSYCRFSSDNWKSDIYAYADCGGWYQIQVANNRHVGDCPEVDWNDLGNFDKLSKAYKKQMDFLADCKHEPIDLPHAGESFKLYSLQELKDKLLELREIGFNVPDDTIECIDEEIQEDAQNMPTKREEK